MPANVQTPAMCKHHASKCANVATANVQFSVLTANVQTRDFKNNLNKLKAKVVYLHQKRKRDIFKTFLYLYMTHIHARAPWTHYHWQILMEKGLIDKQTHSHQHTNTHTQTLTPTHKRTHTHTLRHTYKIRDIVICFDYIFLGMAATDM